MRSVAENMTKLVESKVWISADSVTSRGCVLVAPEGHLFKSNLKHEIQVRADEHALPGTLKAVESIWSKIGEILDEGFELCEATAFCSCTPPAEPMTEQEDFCGYCLKDGEETK